MTHRAEVVEGRQRLGPAATSPGTRGGRQHRKLQEAEGPPLSRRGGGVRLGPPILDLQPPEQGGWIFIVLSSGFVMAFPAAPDTLSHRVLFMQRPPQ